MSKGMTAALRNSAQNANLIWWMLRNYPVLFAVMHFRNVAVGVGLNALATPWVQWRAYEAAASCPRQAADIYGVPGNGPQHEGRVVRWRPYASRRLENRHGGGQVLGLKENFWLMRRDQKADASLRMEKRLGGGEVVNNFGPDTKNPSNHMQFTFSQISII